MGADKRRKRAVAAFQKSMEHFFSPEMKKARAEFRENLTREREEGKAEKRKKAWIGERAEGAYDSANSCHRKLDGHIDQTGKWVATLRSRVDKLEKNELVPAERWNALKGDPGPPGPAGRDADDGVRALCEETIKIANSAVSGVSKLTDDVLEISKSAAAAIKDVEKKANTAEAKAEAYSNDLARVKQDVKALTDRVHHSNKTADAGMKRALRAQADVDRLEAELTKTRKRIEGLVLRHDKDSIITMADDGFTGVPTSKAAFAFDVANACAQRLDDVQGEVKQLHQRVDKVLWGRREDHCAAWHEAPSLLWEDVEEFAVEGDEAVAIFDKGEQEAMNNRLPYNGIRMGETVDFTDDDPVRVAFSELPPEQVKESQITYWDPDPEFQAA